MRPARTLLALVALALGAAAGVRAQAPAPTPLPAPAEDIQITIRGGAERRLSIAVPALFAPGTAALQAQVVDPFTATLRSDLEYAGAFAVAAPTGQHAGLVAVEKQHRREQRVVERGERQPDDPAAQAGPFRRAHEQ